MLKLPTRPKPLIPSPSTDLVSWLVWLISRTLNVACEVEALYMNELLPVQVRWRGEGGHFADCWPCLFSQSIPYALGIQNGLTLGQKKTEKFR